MSSKLYQIKKKFGYHQINDKDKHIMKQKYSGENEYFSNVGKILKNFLKDENEISYINNCQKNPNDFSSSFHRNINRENLNASLYYHPKQVIKVRKPSIPYPLNDHNKNRFHNSFITKYKAQIKANEFLAKRLEVKIKPDIKELKVGFMNKLIKIEDLKIISTLGIGCFSIIKLVSFLNNNFNTYALKIYNRKLIMNIEHESNVIQEKKSFIKLSSSPFIIKL